MAYQIPLDELLEHLANNALGKLDPPLTQNQVLSARILIDKELGNRKPIDDNGTAEDTLVIKWGK